MTKNTGRLNDELLNSSNGLLRSASSPAIAPTMLMRFYPIITRCNEPIYAVHAHIDGMSCCGPPPIGPLGSATKLLSTHPLCLSLMRFYSFNYIGAQNNLKFVNSAEFENFINKWAMNFYFIATDYQATLRVASDHMDDEKYGTIEWWAVE